eukprot:6202530-Pleurochrysis_carterae.AAC.1
MPKTNNTDTDSDKRSWDSSQFSQRAGLDDLLPWLLTANCAATRSATAVALTGVATTVARRISVVCGERILLTTTTRPATPRAHDCTVRTEAESPLAHGAAMCYRDELNNSQHEGNAQRRIHANAKTCKCE